MLPNVLAGTSHNFYFKVPETGEYRFRVRIRVQRPSDTWRISYTNTVFSTWDDGSLCYGGLSGSPFRVVSACVTLFGSAYPAEIDKEQVAPDETVRMTVRLPRPVEGYLDFCWRLQAEKGAILPATSDSQVLCDYAVDDGEFADCLLLEPANLCVIPDTFEAEGDPLPKMVFLGDSITQGCGTRIDRYESWAARIAEALRYRYASHNIGLGFGRIRDAAMNGAWLEKAKDADIVNVCLGVNDILQDQDSIDTCIRGLRKIVFALPRAEVRLFTVPAFDYEGKNVERWRSINEAIPCLGASAVFDMAAITSQGGDRDTRSRFGGHPDGYGGSVIAKAYLARFHPDALYLKAACEEDAEELWGLVSRLPEDENGCLNDCAGISLDDFRKSALPRMEKFARGEDLPEGFVPETFYFLWKGDEAVGEFRLRHFLCDSLRTGGGHIGYSIAPEYRGKGLGSEGLRLLLTEAAKVVPEEEYYLQCNKDNPASLHVMLHNGGRVEHEVDAHYFVRIPKK